MNIDEVINWGMGMCSALLLSLALALSIQIVKMHRFGYEVFPHVAMASAIPILVFPLLAIWGANLFGKEAVIAMVVLSFVFTPLILATAPRLENLRRLREER